MTTSLLALDRFVRSTRTTAAGDVVEITDLHKDFWRLRGGRKAALRGVDLAVPAGGVFGLLGPNGSGKTTTIRCLLGLARPTSGTVRLLGCDVPAALPAVMPRVGAIVETPAMFPTFSGRRNLRLLGRVGGIDNGAVDALLDRVGLASAAGDPVSSYSLGMRQRLGLAAALLRDPDVLILDEPANGLDPAGIREIRSLIRSLADEGRTVVLSSHQLSEVQLVCDRLAILSKGQCIWSGTVDDVLARGGTELRVVVDGADRDAAVAILRAGGLQARRRSAMERHAISVVARPEAAPSITRLLGEGGIWLHELSVHTPTLEDAFLAITGAPNAEDER